MVRNVSRLTSRSFFLKLFHVSDIWQNFKATHWQRCTDVVRRCPVLNTVYIFLQNLSQCGVAWTGCVYVAWRCSWLQILTDRLARGIAWSAEVRSHCATCRVHLFTWVVTHSSVTCVIKIIAFTKNRFDGWLWRHSTTDQVWYGSVCSPGFGLFPFFQRIADVIGSAVVFG